MASPAAARRVGAGPLIIAAGVVLLLAAAFIVLRPGASRCPQAAATIAATLSADGLTPSTLFACRDQAVTLELASEVDGIFHVHGLDAVLPATEISAGRPVTLRFTAAPVGQYPIELHSDAGASDVGVLTINVP